MIERDFVIDAKRQLSFFMLMTFFDKERRVMAEVNRVRILPTDQCNVEK